MGELVTVPAVEDHQEFRQLVRDAIVDGTTPIEEAVDMLKERGDRLLARDFFLAGLKRRTMMRTISSRYRDVGSLRTDPNRQDESHHSNNHH